MDALVLALSRFEIFRGVAPEALAASAPLWRVVLLKKGAVLWKQGRAADSLGLIQSGGLEVVVDGTVIAKAGVGEMIGETALFIRGAKRMASMLAPAMTQVLVLSTAGLHELRAQASPVYTAILHHALLTNVRRGHALDRQIAQVRQGNFTVPPPQEPAGLLSRLWQRVRQPQPELTACPPIEGLLLEHPALANSTPELRAPLIAAFKAQSFRRGEVIGRQGERDPRVFLLAAGTADVLRTIEDRGAALLLGRFEPGSIFGVNAFVESTERTASIVATSDGWIYALTRDAFEALPPEVRLVWMEVMLAVMVGQCQTAGRALQTAIHMFATKHEDLKASTIKPPVEGAWAALEGLQPGDSIAHMRLDRPRKR
jgi:CRP-like cAMP-binding protein